MMARATDEGTSKGAGTAHRKEPSVRFYADYGDKRTKRSGGDAPNAIAVYGEPYKIRGDTMIEAIAALTSEPNSHVCGTSASLGYLRESCKRISEAEAYRIHPRLRAYMALASSALAEGGGS